MSGDTSARTGVSIRKRWPSGDDRASYRRLDTLCPFRLIPAVRQFGMGRAVRPESGTLPLRPLSRLAESRKLGAAVRDPSDVNQDVARWHVGHAYDEQRNVPDAARSVNLAISITIGAAPHSMADQGAAATKCFASSLHHCGPPSCRADNATSTACRRLSTVTPRMKPYFGSGPSSVMIVGGNRTSGQIAANSLPSRV